MNCELRVRAVIDWLLWPLLALTIHAATTDVCHATDYFTKVTSGPVVTDGGDSRSVNFIDYDSDGHLDLFISNGPQGGQVDFLYKGNGDGTFTKVTGQEIVATPAPADGATFGDFDNDGDLDCYVVTWYNVSNLFYHNNGDGTFTRDRTINIATFPSYSEAATWVDYDGDQNLDLQVCNSAGSRTNRLFRNNGDGTFTAITSGSIVADAFSSRVGVWSDYDNDSDLDCFVANEGDQNNNLYRNEGGGTFAKLTTGALVNDSGQSFSASWGDYDNDGNVDLAVANWSNQTEFLYHSNGDGTFTKVLGAPPVQVTSWSVSTAWADIDNDGDLDLFITNAFGPPNDINQLYINNGDGTFTRELTDVTTTDAGWTYGCAFGDIDEDGDLDLAVAKCLGAVEDNALYLNNGNSNHWIILKLQALSSNRSAIGARIHLKATINGVAVWQLREVSSQSGYCSQNQMDPHFGLGDATVIDSIIVEWPTGITTVNEQVPVDQYFAIAECPNVDPDEDGSICVDNCPSIANPDQADADNDGRGDLCDNCPSAANPGQEDNNTDGIGNACCCDGVTANVNYTGTIDGGDLALLVAYLTNLQIQKPTLPCPGEANINASGIVDGADLALLVAYLTNPVGQKPTMPTCP